MAGTQERISGNGHIILILVFINGIALESGYTEHENWYRLLFVSLPLLAIALFRSSEKKETFLRNDDVLKPDHRRARKNSHSIKLNIWKRSISNL